MTKIEVVREDEKATAILKAIRQIDDGAELVPVVRCKDCRYCQRDAYGLWCFNDYEHSLQPDDFCSYGERKDNEV